ASLGVGTVVAFSSENRHTLSPDGAAITRTSAADLIQRWVNVIEFSLDRDWTWDGLDPAGIAITRKAHFGSGDVVSEPAGAITLGRSIAKQSLAGVPAAPRAAVRQSTRLLYFDAFDPKPKAPRKFPSEIAFDYVLQPKYKAGPPAASPLTVSILTPVTTPPTQTPRIVSAGIALSEFVAADDYSGTAPRRRVLWFELAEPPLDPEDAYFV